MRYYTPEMKNEKIYGTDEWRKLNAERWDLMNNGMKSVTDGIRTGLVGLLKKHWCLGYGTETDEEYPHDADYPFDFAEIGDIEILEMYFDHGNWSIRNGVVYKDLAFVQQVDGADEWLTLKRDGEDWVSFGSCSMASIIKEGNFKFKALIGHMSRATVEQCKRLEYTSA